jgi:hypothetical protein
MHVKEINLKKTPELFYCEDPLNEGVFDQDHLEDITVAEGKALKRRAKPKDNAPGVPVDQVANARIEDITDKKHFLSICIMMGMLWPLGS